MELVIPISHGNTNFTETSPENFKLDDPIEQGISSYEQDKNGQKGQFDKEHTTVLERQNRFTVIKLPFPHLYISANVFSRSTENEPFIQNITSLYWRISDNTAHVID